MKTMCLKRKKERKKKIHKYGAHNFLFFLFYNKDSTFDEASELSIKSDNEKYDCHKFITSRYVIK